MFPFPAFAGFRTPPSLSFLQGSMSGSDLTTYTFAAQNLGAADPRRWIIVPVGGVTNAARSISSVKVLGVSATKLVQAEGSTVYRHNSIWAAYVPTGTTGDIEIVWNNSLLRCGYQAYRLLTDIDPTTSLYDFETDITLSGSDLSVSIDRASDGVIVASTTSVGASANSVTWSGASEDYDTQWAEATNQCMSSASASSGASPVSITATSASTTANSVVMCAVSFR